MQSMYIKKRGGWKMSSDDDSNDFVKLISIYTYTLDEL